MDQVEIFRQATRSARLIIRNAFGGCYNDAMAKYPFEKIRFVSAANLKNESKAVRNDPKCLGCTRFNHDPDRRVWHASIRIYPSRIRLNTRKGLNELKATLIHEYLHLLEFMCHRKEMHPTNDHAGKWLEMATTVQRYINRQAKESPLFPRLFIGANRRGIMYPRG